MTFTTITQFLTLGSYLFTLNSAPSVFEPSLCPCNFVIETDRFAPSLDFIVSRPSKTKTPYTSNELNEFDRTSFSRYNQTNTNAFTRNNHFRFHRVHVPAIGLFTLVVQISHHVGNVPAHNVRVFHVKRQSTRSETCPIILPQQMPTSNVTKTITRQTFSKIIQHRTEQTKRVSKSEDVVLRQKIVGGDASGEDLARYMVLILQDGSPICSGVLISPRTVLTAAHCVDRTYSNYTIYAGGTDFANNRGTLINTISVEVHPRYKYVKHNHRLSLFDIAYVSLSEDAPASARFMRVNVNRSVPVVSSVARVAGYGVIAQDAENWDEQLELFRLYQVDVPIVSGQVCTESYKSVDIEVNDSRNICAGYYGVGKCDSCYGDSGGPLFQYDPDNVPVVIGTVSSGNGCADPDYPGIYVRVSKFHRFVPRDDVKYSMSVVSVILDTDGVSTTIGNSSLTSSHSPSPNPSSSPLASIVSKESNGIITIALPLLAGLVCFALLVAILFWIRRKIKSP